MIKLERKENCCGCTACFSVCNHNAITLQNDEQGFVYPKFDIDKCVNCGLCDSACPTINSDKKNEGYLNIYALRIKNEDVLKRSSSGGAFYAIASYVITVLKGVVFGAAYDDNMQVLHTYSESLEGLKGFHGSKYVQSNIRNVFEKVKGFLKDGRYVLFSGTPCQVMALRLYLRKDYDHLILLDIVCHSVSSPKFFKEYIEYVEKKKKKKLISLELRNKKYGWSHAFYCMYHFSDGTKLGSDTLRLRDWNRIFFSGFVTRPSCNECKFTSFERSGDVTIADFWDDNNNRPELRSPLGTSLFIVSTKKGVEMLQKIKGDVHYWPITEEEAFQPCLGHPVPVNEQRGSFWEYYNKHHFVRTYKKYFRGSFIKRALSKSNDIIKKLFK